MHSMEWGKKLVVVQKEEDNSDCRIQKDLLDFSLKR